MQIVTYPFRRRVIEVCEFEDLDGSRVKCTASQEDCTMSEDGEHRCCKSKRHADRHRCKSCGKTFVNE
jgi:hypothetical protein